MVMPRSAQGGMAGSPKGKETKVKKSLVALLLTALVASTAAAQSVITPAGSIMPDGRLTYVVPMGQQSGIAGPISQDCGAGYPGSYLPVGPQQTFAPAYPVSYPSLWIPALMIPESPDRGRHPDTPTR
jgi:hypothetical protein